MTKKPQRLLPLLLQLTFFLFVWQVLMLFYAGDNSVLLNIVMQRFSIIPGYVWLEIAGYYLVELLLYFLLTVLLWCVVRLIAEFYSLPFVRMRLLGLVLWWIAVFALYFANEVFYPNSLFGMMFFVFFSFPVAKFTLTLLLIMLCGAIFIALYQLVRKSYRYWFFWATLLVLSVIVVAYNVAPYEWRHEKVQVGHYSQPNIFIIGLDALRPDRIHANGYPKNQTPNLDQFLKQSVNFRNSITPLARTSPAWVSILTGQYPIHNGVRFNLVAQQPLKLQDSLAYILRRHGYYTIFATDGRRFNFIGHDFGFEKVLGASATVTNFLMGAVDNSPIVNLLADSFLGQLLFPNIYGNRDIDFTYYPTAFSNLVEEGMPKKIHQPIFMAIHFTLSHFPYYWAEQQPSINAPPAELYDIAVHRVDQQFEDFIRYLNRQGLLNNAIVIVLSDHGEALELPGDRMLSYKHYIKGKKSSSTVFDSLNALQRDNKDINTSAGHGTDVLSYSQFNNLLAFRTFGPQKKVEPSTINRMVSLVDLKSTLLHLINVSFKKHDGISLVPYLYGEPYQQNRYLFAEIGFTPTSIKTTKISIPNAVLQSEDLFTIQPVTHRVIMKSKAVKDLLKTKQRAVYYQNWVLALYPKKNYQLMPVLVNRTTGQWTDDLSSPFAQQSPAKEMMRQLIKFYGAEVRRYYPG